MAAASNIKNGGAKSPDKSKRYLFIGDFHPSFLGLFSSRGQVVWVTSLKEALSQTGEFTVIMIAPKSFSAKIYKQLAKHFTHTPMIVDSPAKPTDPPPFVRFVPFQELLSSYIQREEKLATTELRVEELRSVHHGAHEMLILMHDNPDPDSIASALGLRTLLKRNKLTAKIGHLGEEVSRPENLAMIELLEIDIENLSPEDVLDFDSIALVDVQPPYFGSLLSQVDTVIDHHPGYSSYLARFSEVKTEEGATSTIITDYLRAAQVDISERLATALFLGIKTDTVSLNREANADDIEAFTFLYPLSSLGLLRKIERADMPPHEIRVFGKALANFWEESGIFFCNVGKVDREYLIPKMADFGIQTVGLDWAVVYGTVADTHLVISVRNVGYVKSAGRLLKEIFGEIGSAGGHRSAAKAVIPLKNVKNELGSTSEKAVKDWICGLIAKAVTEQPKT